MIRSVPAASVSRSGFARPLLSKTQLRDCARFLSTVPPCVAILCSTAGIAGAPAKSSKPLVLTPDAYALKVASIGNCADFDAQAASLPNAGPLLSNAAIAGGSSLSKDEFETTAQFEARQAGYWRDRVGSLDRIVVRIPIDSYKVSYDADHGTALVKYVVNWMVDDQEIQFAGRDLSRRKYVGTNAYGVSVDVTSVRAAKDILAFRTGQLPGDAGGPVSPTWSIPLAPSDAKAFKADAALVLLASLESPFIVRSSLYSGATIDDRFALSLSKTKFRVRLRCGAFVSGGRVIRAGLVPVSP